MAFILRVLLTSLFVISSVLGEPCPLEDETCVTESIRNVYKEFVKDVPSYGIKSSDPILVDEVSISMPKFNNTFTNSTFSGLKDCNVVNARFADDTTKLEMNLNCPKITLNAGYELNGEILLIKLNGKGEAFIESDNADMNILLNVKQNNKGTKSHLHIENFDYDIDVNDKVVYDFKDLFNGNEVLSKAVHDSVNNNWKTMSKHTHKPAMRKYMDILMENLNKYLDNVAMDKIFG